MANQSGIQTFIQNMAGTQTQAQANTPGAVNNGNPNTVYNWASYVPTVTPGQQGGAPSVSFQQVTAPWSPAAPGYQSPFTADPAVAAVLAGMPRATGNDNVNRILNNMFNATRPITGTGPGTGTPGPTTPGPTTPGPTTPTTPTRPGNTGGPPTPVGPISGPVASNPHDFQTWYGNAQPNTNLTDSGYGRQAALDWMSTPIGTSVGDWLRTSTTSNGGVDSNSSVWQNVWGFISDIPGQLGAELRELWQSATGQEGWRSALGFWGAIMGIPGLQEALNFLSPEPVDVEALNASVLAGQHDAIQEQFRRALANINASLNDQGGLSWQEIESYFPDAALSWTPQQWRDMQDTMNWNNFWLGRPGGVDTGGTRQHTIGLPATDFVDNMLNGMHREALNMNNWFQSMAGTRER